MFEQDATYRVYLRAPNGQLKREGKFVSANDSLLKLDIEGIHVIFPLIGGNVNYIMRVDEAREAENSQAKGQAWIDAMR